MMPLEGKEDAQPVGPHGEMELPKAWMRELESVLGKRYIYFCPNCRKVLGVSHRKGFRMGSTATGGWAHGSMAPARLSAASQSQFVT